MNAKVGDIVIPSQTAPEIPQPLAPQPITPMYMLQVSVERGDDLARIEKLMELERSWKADRAREAFYEALSAFHASAPTVLKDKDNAQYKSKYATLGNFANVVNSALAKHGLNASWELDQADGIKVTCTLTHTLGHSKSVWLKAPPDTSGSKNPLQQIKSTITYLEGATIQAVTGIVAQDKNINPEDDGNGSGPEAMVNEAQIAHIEALIGETDTKLPQFLKWAKVAKLEEIPAKSYETVVKMLEAKKGRTQK